MLSSKHEFVEEQGNVTRVSEIDRCRALYGCHSKVCLNLKYCGWGSDGSHVIS